MTVISQSRIIFFPVLFFLAASALYGQSQDAACRMCHGNNALNTTRQGQSVSLYVDGAILQSSAHETLSCSSCHTNFKPTPPHADPVQPVNCESCHGIEGFPENVHTKNGTAACKDCHGTHNIKPSSDPDSSVNAENLAAACRKCHPGANEKFTRGRIHTVEISAMNAGALYWIRKIYLVIIFVTIGLMFLHNLLDFIKRTRRRFDTRRGRRFPSQHGLKQYVRMTMTDRAQHAALLVSFLLLALTGFMLRFPDAWWATAIRSYWPRFFEMGGIVHRCAAVLITSAGLFHIMIIIFTRHGRKFAADVFPKWNDVKDVFINIRYLLGLSSKKPRFDRFGYAEKAEYWALVWGMVIMFATGVFLWFYGFFMNLFGKIGLDIARTIHFYEALLATLAIVVWHFYFVLFNPDVYPMNTTWIDGKISEEEMAEEHPLELERIRRQEQEARESEPPTAGTVQK